MSNRIAVLLGLAASLVSSRPLLAADSELPSLWRTAEMVVDGSPLEWAGKLVPVPDSPFSLGVQNDGSFVYICLRTSDDAMKKRIRATGLTFYLDASGKDEKAFGVRYPAPTAPPPGGATEGFRPMASPDDIVILGKEEADRARMSLQRARPLAAAMAETTEALVLELKVPLAFGIETPFAVQTTPGKTISVGVESALPPRASRPGSRRREGFNGMGARGGMGSGGGFRAPRGYGGRGEGASEGDRPAAAREPADRSYGKPLKKWFRVPLASSAQ